MNLSTTGIWNERLRLAALERDELVRIGLVSVMVGLIYVMYHLLGNTTDPRVFSRSAFLWLAKRWDQTSGDFSHGWLMPIIALALVWWRRDALARAAKQTSGWGLAVVATGLVMHYLGAKAQVPHFSLLALITIIWGIPFYFYGWNVAKILIFPSAYLIFAIPLNALDQFTFPLRMVVTIGAEHTLNGLGIMVERTGSILRSVDGSFALNVDDPCSGLRSILALTAITAVYAYLTQRTLVRKWLLFLASVPIAVVGNLARILTIALVAQSFGQELATGLYHDYSGFIFFPIAIGLMLGTGTLLSMNFRTLPRRIANYFRAPHYAPTRGLDTVKEV